jgi:5-carboxymethyl-2-hydroxymuconate isomerase
MGRGRSDAARKKVGETLRAVVQEHFSERLANSHIGVTFQIDEGQEVFDAKLSSIHSLFARN